LLLRLVEALQQAGIPLAAAAEPGNGESQAT
jgi:hypothetical protein